MSRTCEPAHRFPSTWSFSQLLQLWAAHALRVPPHEEARSSNTSTQAPSEVAGFLSASEPFSGLLKFINRPFWDKTCYPSSADSRRQSLIRTHLLVRWTAPPNPISSPSHFSKLQRKSRLSDKKMQQQKRWHPTTVSGFGGACGMSQIWIMKELNKMWRLSLFFLSLPPVKKTHLCSCWQMHTFELDQTYTFQFIFRIQFFTSWVLYQLTCDADAQ